ncbi:MAG TPA: hypothetical protein DEP84_33650 [Chloroflexi bacterium]|nr:hypothetical protein [Chloroflexota bacterium]
MDALRSIAGLGAGASSLALFGRGGGESYTKAADIGADSVGKIKQDMPEDNPHSTQAAGRLVAIGFWNIIPPFAGWQRRCTTTSSSLWYLDSRGPATTHR